MAKIKKLQDNNGATIYPLTSVDAVFDQNGKTLTGGGVLTYISTLIPTDLFLKFVLSDNKSDEFGIVNGDAGVCCLIFNNGLIKDICYSSYGILSFTHTGPDEYTYTLKSLLDKFIYTKVYDKNTIQSLLADNNFETTGWTRIN